MTDRLPPHSDQCERGILSCLLSNPELHLGPVMQALHDGPLMFYDVRHQMIYETILAMDMEDKPIEPVALRSELGKRHQDKYDWFQYIVSIMDAGSDLGLGYYLETVTQRYGMRRTISVCTETSELADDHHGSVSWLLDGMETKLNRIRHRNHDSGVGATEAVVGFGDDLDRRMAAQGTRSGVVTGLADLDEITDGLQYGEQFVIGARPSIGKAQPKNSRVKLCNGAWTTMGELKVGDSLASIDGRQSLITGIFPQGYRQVYRVTFSDGRSTRCCHEHLWSVSRRDWKKKDKIVTTGKLISMLNAKRNRNRLFIETFSGEFGMSSGLPVEPWLLGFLIGDGDLAGAGIRFASADKELVDLVSESIPHGLHVVHSKNYDYRISQKNRGHVIGLAVQSKNGLKVLLEELGLSGTDCYSKFIPQIYMESSKENRTALLRGLMDTDGWCEKNGSLMFCSTSQRLSEQVVELVRSLGGTATIRERKRPTYHYKGEKRTGAPAYTCCLQYGDSKNLFTLKRKRARTKIMERIRRLNIVSIEPDGAEECLCISVSHPAQLYITDDYIVTHNTAIGLNIFKRACLMDGVPSVFISLEQSYTALMRRLASAWCHINMRHLKRGQLTDVEVARLHEFNVAYRAAPATIYDFVDGGASADTVASVIKRIARKGVKLVIIDYLQKVRPNERHEKRTYEVGETSGTLRAAAVSCGVAMVTLAQLNREPEKEKGRIPKLSDLADSGQIERDADVVGLLHRDRAMSAGPACLCIAKQRDGETGIVNLHFDGRYCEFTNGTTAEYNV